MFAHHSPNYLSGAIFIDNSNANDSLYYSYTDNQGSVIALTDESGNVKRKYAYDPWGDRRNPVDWTQKDNGSNLIINRGYTGHEHLDQFAIINMNGRVYDPLTAMFFSPDPFIQSMGDWKNYNRYSYCMNNPTRYTDPSGYRYRDPAEQPLEPFEYIGFTNYAGRGGGRGNAGNFARSFYRIGFTSWDEITKEAQNLMDNAPNGGVSYGDGNTYYFKTQEQAYFFGYKNLNTAEATTKRQLASINASAKDIISSIPTGADIMVSLSQEFTKINPGKFTITTINGMEMIMTTDQLIVGLELASKYTLVGGIFVEGTFAIAGDKDARQNFWSDTMVSLSLYTISVAGCGVPALVLGIGWVMYRNGVFDGMFDRQFYQNNFRQKTTPQDAIPKNQFKDRFQPIFIQH